MSNTDLVVDGEDEDWEPEPQPLWVKLALVAAVAAVIALAVGVGIHLTRSGGSDNTANAPSGPEGVPLQNFPALAPAVTSGARTPIDGITCTPTMSIRYHIHVHLNIFVNGAQKIIPATIGMRDPIVSKNLPGGMFYDNGPTGCVYWLHVHADDGIIHVEAPSTPAQPFTLGEFFDVWGQPLSSAQVGPAPGDVVAFVDGKRFTGDPRDIALRNHGVVQLDVGAPVVKFIPMTFDVSGLCSTTCGLGS